MEKMIDIDLFIENPKVFFSQLPEKAQAEISEFLQFVIYKYNIKIANWDNKKNDFLSKIEKHKYSLPKDYKFNRDEVNER